MKRVQAPTLLGLIGAGFIVVTLPLVVAIVTAIVQVDGLARDSREALVSVQQNTSVSRALADRVRELERTARQYQALGDVEYKALYEQHRDAVRSMLERLMSLNEHADMRAVLERAEAAETAANESVDAIGSGASSAELEAAFKKLQEESLTIVQRLDEKARDLSNALPQQADGLQRLLMTQAALVIPLSIGLALLFAMFISRSVGQIEQSIRSLGRGALREPIRVTGTRDLEELGRRLEWLRVRLMDLETQKAEFLRNVSHELKTPLSNIREAAELLFDGEGANGAESRTIATILRNNGVRLQKMIEELLRYGAISASRSDRGGTSIRLDELVGEAVRGFSEAQASGEIEISTSLAPVVVEGNAEHLKVIVDNLLSNAVRYARSRGKVDVDLHVDEGIAVLDVRDNGPGIREEDAPHVFDWFFTGQHPEGAMVAGTGMGLAIAQEYAQQHGGQILLLPSDTGAHFRLTLTERSHAEG